MTVTVKELIEELQKMPPDAEVYIMAGPYEGQTIGEEIPPSPDLMDDERVCL